MQIPFLSNFHRRFVRASAIYGAMAALLLTVAACDRDPMVRVYEVELRKPNPSQAASTTTAEVMPKRMLGAVIPAGERSIFLKMTGSPEALEPFLGSVKAIAESAKLNGEEVELAIPEGWSKGPGTAIAAYTLVPPSMDGVDAAMTVTVLPGATELEEWKAYVQQNLDRWRGQLGLAPVPLAEDTADAVQVISASGTDLPAYVVNFVGTSSGKPSMPPFAGGMASSGASPGSTAITKDTQAAPPPAPAPGAMKIKFDLPEGWLDKTGEGSSIRLATLKTSSEPDAAEVTVVMAGGEEKTIVELWAQSVLGPELTTAELVDQVIAGAQAIQNATGVPGKLYQIKPPTADASEEAQAILVSVFPLQDADGQRSLFAKLTGKANIVDQNQSKFESFVQSLNWQE